MRLLIQRVSKASVEVDGEIISKINRGLLLFVGVTHEDDRGIADHLAQKSAQLR
ncbi:MAG: D-aminoacyl-tRNA deacylase, partial [SAR324 cluster bacterium]|nr:D-aminoacyl-tRNA deacylase [SAR324 cluster bacterium]